MVYRYNEKNEEAIEKIKKLTEAGNRINKLEMDRTILAQRNKNSENVIHINYQIYQFLGKGYDDEKSKNQE